MGGMLARRAATRKRACGVGVARDQVEAPTIMASPIYQQGAMPTSLKGWPIAAGGRRSAAPGPDSLLLHVNTKDGGNVTPNVGLERHGTDSLRDFGDILFGNPPPPPQTAEDVPQSLCGCIKHTESL